MVKKFLIRLHFKTAKGPNHFKKTFHNGLYIKYPSKSIDFPK